MSNSTSTRIPRDIAGFIIYIRATDARQLAIDPITSAARYLNWGWNNSQSVAWTGFRTAADLIYVDWENVEARSSLDTKGLHLVIKNTVAYDDAHHLLNKIGNTNVPPAVLLDFAIFHVIRDTPLEDLVKSERMEDDAAQPKLFMKKTGTLYHKIGYQNLLAPESVARPKDVKETEIWTAYKAEADHTAVVDADYVKTGEVKRGSCIVNFLSAQLKGTAYHRSRYKFKNGKFSNFCDAVSGSII